MAAINNRKIEIVKLLIGQKGIDINAKDNQGNSALSCAAKSNIEMLKLIVEKDSTNINITNNSRQTALMIAAQYHCIDNVKFLLEQKGITVNAQNSSVFVNFKSKNFLWIFFLNYLTLL